ncbi:hypothetical protein [Nocardia rhamnosiphila]|uniref:Uncharacterized protein n=1 Tax=Nocardia rhamnosiphila TaxID=426716 RepID=A0ABV2WVS8_9NOCA
MATEAVPSASSTTRRPLISHDRAPRVIQVAPRSTIGQPATCPAVDRRRNRRPSTTRQTNCPRAPATSPSAVRAHSSGVAATPGDVSIVNWSA